MAAKSIITTSDIQALETTLAKQYRDEHGETVDVGHPDVITTTGLMAATGDGMHKCRTWLKEQEAKGRLVRVRVRGRTGGMGFGWRKPSK